MLAILSCQKTSIMETKVNYGIHLFRRNSIVILISIHSLMSPSKTEVKRVFLSNFLNKFFSQFANYT